MRYRSRRIVRYPLAVKRRYALLVLRIAIVKSRGSLANDSRKLRSISRLLPSARGILTVVPANLSALSPGGGLRAHLLRCRRVSRISRSAVHACCNGGCIVNTVYIRSSDSLWIVNARSHRCFPTPSNLWTCELKYNDAPSARRSTLSWLFRRRCWQERRFDVIHCLPVVRKVHVELHSWLSFADAKCFSK